MFGFYDPASLEVGANAAAINFIDAAAGTVTRVDITSVKEASLVVTGLRDQGLHGIASRHGAVQTLHGTLAWFPSAPDEGLMMIEGEKKSIPVKLAFDMDPDTLPKNSFAMAQGVHHDGAFVINKVAMKSFGPGAEPRPAQKDEQRMN